MDLFLAVRSSGGGQRVKRFLLKRRAKRLRVVVLADDVSPELWVELRDVLGRHWDERRVVLRSGTSLKLEHLRRVAYRDAAAIIIPGSDYLADGAIGTDTRVIKTLISLSPHERREGGGGPAVVAEIFDEQKIQIAEEAYRGGELDVVASDAFISRLIAQNVRHPGLSYVYTELLSYARGNEIYVRSLPFLEGRTFGSLVGLFKNSILIGLVRPDGLRFEPHMNPRLDTMVEQGDRLVFIARSYDQCEPNDEAGETSFEMGATEIDVMPPITHRRILILGWNHKVAPLIREFGSYSSESFQIDILSRTPINERKMTPDFAANERVIVRHVEGDYTLRETVASIKPAEYGNIVFLASDSMESGEESDARTVLGYVLLRSLLGESSPPPEVVIELMDPENAHLFRRRSGEVIISPLIMSHILAHVALRRELSAVYNELFGPEGAEVYFRTASSYGLSVGPFRMPEIQEIVRSRKEIALGVRIARERENLGGGVHLNPGEEAEWKFEPEDEVVVLTTM